MIVVTPICPHPLAARSIVLSGEDRVTIRLGPGHRAEHEEVFASFDGGGSVPMATGIPRRTNSSTGAIPLASFKLDAGLVTANRPLFSNTSMSPGLMCTQW